MVQIDMIHAGANITLAHSSMPASLTYTSSIVNTAWKLLQLPFILSGFTKESETLNVRMFERIEFLASLDNIPTIARIRIATLNGKIQIYKSKLRLIARFEGLRWIVYSYPIISMAVFSTAFSTVALASASSIWLLFWS